MREERSSLNDLTKKTIDIGYVGEQNHTRIIFSCASLFSDYPSATATMVVKPPVGDVYPVVVERENNSVIWNISSSDVARAGGGQYQITFTNGNEIIKQAIGSFTVKPSLSGSGTAPDPVADWIADASEVLVEVEAAVASKIDEPEVPGEDGQVLTSDGNGGTEWRTPSGGGGGGGTSNYNDLTNKPKINSVTLSGNKSLSDLGIASANSLGGKADKVYNATSGHFAALDTNGNLTDSGCKSTDFLTSHQDISGKADKVTSATSGHFAGLDSSGNLTDSGKSASDFATPTDVNAKYTKPAGGIPGTDLADSYIEEPSSEGTSGQVLTTDGNGGRSWTTVQGGGGGTSNYNDLTNKPQINSVSLSGNKSLADLGIIYNYVTPEDYGAVGDGTTDDSEAVQDACDAGYNVYFASNKTYYIPTAIEIDHDIHLYGGDNTKIITSTPSGGTLNDIFVVSGTLKTTTTLTTDYTSSGNTDNSGNMWTLADMSDVAAGDIMVVQATDQHYSYARQYYYLGMTLMVADKDSNHIYTTSSMPWDMTLTNNVSVKVYSAPSVIIENLNFVADRDSIGNYKYFVKLIACKDSIVRNCKMSEMDCGARIEHCFNTLFENIFLSDGKNDNTISGDGYGIHIYASTDTVFERMIGMCAQTAITTGGDVVVVNVYVRNSELGSQCRHHGVGMHENSYNIVVEDCTFTGLNVLGTGTVNRCRFVNNRRLGGQAGGITFCGSHNPKYAVLKVNECTFEGNAFIYISAPSLQDPVQAFDCIVGLLEVTDCNGGYVGFDGTTNTYITSNRINEMNLRNWRNCREVYLPNAYGIIDKLTVRDCEFSAIKWINDHNGNIMTGNVHDLDFSSTIPMAHKKTANKDTYGEQYTLPENVSITLSATNSTTAKYIVCGNNLASNYPDDWVIGNVTGSDGGTLTRTPATSSNKPTISNDSDGNIVFSQNSGTGTWYMYPVGMFYVSEYGTITMSAKLKNTGSTDPASFRPYIAVVDCSTGNLVSRYSSTAVQATAQGATISYSHGVTANCVAMCYYYCSTAVANSVTTFEDMSVINGDYFVPMTSDIIQPYTAKRLTGDGSILSLPGVNNIMSSEDTFHVSFSADYINNPIGVLPYGSGVSF